MFAILEARRQVRLHAAAWAAEAIDTYGDDAEEVLRAEEAGHGHAERYAFRQVRKVIRARLNRQTFADGIGAFLKDVALNGPTAGAR